MASTSLQGPEDHSERTPWAGGGWCRAAERTLAQPTLRLACRLFAATFPRCRHSWARSRSVRGAWGHTRVAVWAFDEPVRLAGVKSRIRSILRVHSIGNQTLRSRLNGLWVFVQTGLPIRLAGRAGGRGRAGSAGWGLGCHCACALYHWASRRVCAREGALPLPLFLVSCACVLRLGARLPGVGRGRGRCPEGAGSQWHGRLVCASCWVWSPPARAQAARRRSVGGACARLGRGRRSGFLP